MQEINNKNIKILITDYESIFSRSPIVSYNEDYIEIPGVVLFARKKEKRSFFDRLLNPGIEIIDIEDTVFNQMLEAIKSQESESHVIVVDSIVKPTKTTLINLEALKDAFVFARVDIDSIAINEYVFTNNEFEFHGDGMFTSRKVYLLDFENMSKLKSVILG